MNSAAVQGPECCTINSTPPGVSRVLSTDNTITTTSNSEETENMNIMDHGVINQIHVVADITNYYIEFDKDRG